MVFQSQGVWSEAERLYKEALDRKDGLSQTHFNLGYVYLEQGRFKLAVRENERVLELDPPNADAHVNLASAWLGLAAPERALSAYESALELLQDGDENRRRVLTQLALLKQEIASVTASSESSATQGAR
jgi:tetratricopeptide (TPR) repeat protein